MDNILIILSAVAVIPIVTNNIWLIYAVLHTRQLRTFSNICMVSAAFSDLFVGLVVTPLFIAANTYTGPMNMLLCVCLWSLVGLSPVVSFFHLLVITAQKYISIVRPLHYNMLVTQRKLVAGCIFAWMFPMIILSFPPLGWNNVDYSYKGNLTYKDDCDYINISTMGYRLFFWKLYIFRFMLNNYYICAYNMHS